MVLNGLLDSAFIAAPFAEKQLGQVLGGFVAGKSPELVALLYSQMGWGMLFHGVVRIFAGLNFKSPEARRLAQLSYTFESLQFLALAMSGHTTFGKIPVFLLLPALMVWLIEKQNKKKEE